MNIAMLPWDRLPALVLGALYMLLSGALSFEKAKFSREGAKTLFIFLTGAAIFAYGVA